METKTDLPRFVIELLAAFPKRGEGLNRWLFGCARVLHPYRFEKEIIELLKAATYGESVKPNEIERAVANSKSYIWQPGEESHCTTAAWPEFSEKERQAVIAAGGSLAALWEASPVRLDSNKPHTEEIIDLFFPGNPLLCCGKSQSVFDTQSREEWRGRLTGLSHIVPSPMTARRGLSGNRSIHGWFICLDESEETFREFMEYAVRLGADHATWCRSQFVRMPDGLREDGQRQAVYYLDPELIA
jgi:hypothetical protein